MAVVTYHGPRPEITASFPMGSVSAFSRDNGPPIADVLTFRNGRPDEPKKPGPHSYVLPRDHPVPVGVVFATGLAILVRERGRLRLTIRLGPGDWALACAALPGLRRVTPRMLATPRRRRLLGAMLLRRSGAEAAVVQRLSTRAWQSPFAVRLSDEAVPRVTYLRRFYRRPVAPVLRWSRRALASLRWDPQTLRASSFYNLSVNEDLNWRTR